MRAIVRVIKNGKSTSIRPDRFNLGKRIGYAKYKKEAAERIINLGIVNHQPLPSIRAALVETLGMEYEEADAYLINNLAKMDC